MAGTGHAYEVVNHGLATGFLSEIAAPVPYPEGRAWLTSAPLLRYVTSPQFVVTVKGDEALEAIRRNASDPAEAAILTRKLADGGDLRMFVPEFLSRFDDVLRHLADWIAALPNADPRLIPKLGRITPDAAVRHADRWTSRAVRKAATAGRGLVAPLMEPARGMIWVELLDGAALVEESSMANHCVHGYADRLGHGTRILSLRNDKGKSLVTVEALLRFGEGVDEGWDIGQVRAHSNALPSRDTWPCVEALLNFLGIVGDAYGEAARIMLLKDTSGKWAGTQDVATRVDILGWSGYSHEGRVYLPSPVSPDRILAIFWNVRGIDPTTGRFERAMLSPVGDARDHSLFEQRSLAAFAQRAGIERSNIDYLVRDANGRWVCWLDSCEFVDLGGVECPVKDGTAFILSASGRDVVARIPLEGPRLATLVAAAREWSATDVRCMATVMTALGAQPGEYEKWERLRAAGLDQASGGEWRNFYDYAAEHPYRGDAATAHRWRWLASPWRISLENVASRRSAMRISLDADGAVQGFLDPRFLSPEHVGDACRLLNELGVPALSTRHVAYLRNRTRDRNGCILAFVDRRWRILESGHEIPALLHGLGRRQFRDPTCTELAIWWLSGSHRSADMGVPYARHVAAWAARTISKDAVAAVLRGASPVLGCLDEPRMLDRLLDVAPLLPSLSIRERGAIIRLAERVVRAAIGRSRRPRILDSRRSIVERIVLALGRDLSERLLSRAIPWLLGSFEGLASQEARRSSPEGPLRPVIDPRWRQLAALPTSSARVRAFIRQAAYNSLYALCAEGIALSSEAADDWLWCIEQQVASESGWRLESSLEKVSLVEQGVSAALSDDELSRGIRRRIDALRSLIPRDVAAAGETEPELRAA